MDENKARYKYKILKDNIRKYLDSDPIARIVIESLNNMDKEDIVKIELVGFNKWVVKYIDNKKGLEKIIFQSYCLDMVNENIYDNFIMQCTLEGASSLSEYYFEYIKPPKEGKIFGKLIGNIIKYTIRNFFEVLYMDKQLEPYSQIADDIKKILENKEIKIYLDSIKEELSVLYINIYGNEKYNYLEIINNIENKLSDDLYYKDNNIKNYIDNISFIISRILVESIKESNLLFKDLIKSTCSLEEFIKLLKDLYNKTEIKKYLFKDEMNSLINIIYEISNISYKLEKIKGTTEDIKIN
ncbi:hypothetical protein YN1_6930 [Nanoarchaeota archaeon]